MTTFYPVFYCFQASLVILISGFLGPCESGFLTTSTFTAEKAGIPRGCDLPNVTQLIRGRAGIRTQELSRGLLPLESQSLWGVGD